MRECKGCGADLTGTHGRRIWCSDRCRKLTLYARRCVDCGAPCNVDGRLTNPAIRCNFCALTRNAEENERIRELWNEGAPQWYVAQELGLPDEVVRSRIQCMRESGLDVELHRRRNRVDWPEIERLWNSGATAREIGEKLNITAANVYERLKRMREVGIDVPHRGKDWARKAAA